jgi:DNA-binding response OmpR family regulator
MSAARTRVLMVDDDPDVAWAVGRYLTRAGFLVVTCRDGAEAIAVLQTHTFDVVVTDIQMPRVNGLALMDWVQKHRAAMRAIVMTAYGSASLHAAALHHGAILYLEKPVDPDVLVKVLQERDHKNFSGTVDDIDLFEYVQMRLISRRDTRIRVTSREGDKGELFLHEGNVVHATCGDLQGEAAFHRCLGFEGGSFSSLPWHEPERVSITERGDFLLMDAARHKDEATKPADAEPAPGAPRAAPPQDGVDEQLFARLLPSEGEPGTRDP